MRWLRMMQDGLTLRNVKDEGIQNTDHRSCMSDKLTVEAESSSPPSRTIRFSICRLALYSLSRYATTSDAFSPLISSSFSWLAVARGCHRQPAT